jgi:hypothetical protein
MAHCCVGTRQLHERALARQPLSVHLQPQLICQFRLDCFNAAVEGFRRMIVVYVVERQNCTAAEKGCVPETRLQASVAMLSPSYSGTC